MKEIIDSFVEATMDDLYDSHGQAEASALSPELFDRYLSGELGSNELLEHKAMLYGELEDILAVIGAFGGTDPCCGAGKEDDRE